jgi:hypothetical protein
VSDDVADRDADPIGTDLDHVVPIAAHVEFLGAGAVAGRDGDPRVRWERTREQALLEGGRDRVLQLIELRTFERLGAERDDRSERGPLTPGDRSVRRQLQRHDTDRASSRIEHGRHPNPPPCSSLGRSNPSYAASKPSSESNQISRRSRTASVAGRRRSRDRVWKGSISSESYPRQATACNSWADRSSTAAHAEAAPTTALPSSTRIVRTSFAVATNG